MNASLLVNFALSSVVLAMQFQVPGEDVAREIDKLHSAVHKGDVDVALTELAEIERKIALLSSPVQRGNLLIEAAEVFDSGGMKRARSTPIILRLVAEARTYPLDVRDAVRAHTMEGDVLLALEHERIELATNPRSFQELGRIKPGAKVRARAAEAYLHGVALLVKSEKTMTPVDLTPSKAVTSPAPVPYSSAEDETNRIPPRWRKETDNKEALAAHNAALRHDALVYHYRALADKLGILYSASKADEKELAALTRSILKSSHAENEFLEYVDANRPKPAPVRPVDIYVPWDDVK